MQEGGVEQKHVLVELLGLKLLIEVDWRKVFEGLVLEIIVEPDSSLRAILDREILHVAELIDESLWSCLEQIEVALEIYHFFTFCKSLS